MKKNILLVATGSVAIEKLEKFLELLAPNFNVKIIATKYVIKNFENWGNIKIESEETKLNSFPLHIKHTKWADQIVVVPATANTIAKFYACIADNQALSTLIACRQPIVFVPAMNMYMYKSLVERSIIDNLSKMGHMFIGPCVGKLREGEIGLGRMVEPKLIVKQLENLLLEKKKKKILISIGASKIYIDPIRYITNGASGKFGKLIANELRLFGHQVETLNISSLTNEQALEEICSKNIDTYISAAAFADFKIKKYSNKKIKKQTLNNIELLDNLDVLSKVSNKNLDVYGFKLDDNKINAINKKRDLNLKGIIWNKINAINSDLITGAIILDKKEIPFNNQLKSEIAKLIAREI